MRSPAALFLLFAILAAGSHHAIPPAESAVDLTFQAQLQARIDEYHGYFEAMPSTLEPLDEETQDAIYRELGPLAVHQQHLRNGLRELQGEIPMPERQRIRRDLDRELQVMDLGFDRVQRLLGPEVGRWASARPGARGTS